jgi:hypothetical protein
MTTKQVLSTINDINKLRPRGTPKIYPDIIGMMILGIDVIRLDDDLKTPDGLSLHEYCIEIYGQEVADMINENININNLITKETEK